MRVIRSLVHSIGRGLGVDVVPYLSVRHSIGRRLRLLKALDVDLVMDVGANGGGYAGELRTFGYRGRILSFEPLTEPFERLRIRSSRDPYWDIQQIAIGSEAGRRHLNVAANRGASSSFLPMLDLHAREAPTAGYVAVEDVAVERLDVSSAHSVQRARSPFLKVDVQGYEAEVLQGAAGILDRLVGMQLELSLTPLYQDAPHYRQLLSAVSDLGFDLVGLEPGFTATDGRLLQADGLFARREGPSR